MSRPHVLAAVAVGVLAFCCRPARALDLNAILCDPAGWKYDTKYVSVSKQTAHVRGGSPGLLFEYTRDSKDLFDAKGKLVNTAYRPRASKELKGLDLSAYDLLSFWIYVEGNAEEAFQWGFGSVRPFRLSCRNGEWFHARCYLCEVPQDLKHVDRIFFAGVNQGSPPGDSKRAKIYLSDFRLEKTDRRPHIGWSPDPKEIVLSYAGVRPGEAVTAVVAPEHAGKAYALSGEGVRKTGRVSDVTRSRRTEYAEIDLVAPEKPGDYRIEIEGGINAPLLVREGPFGEAVGKALNLIRAQRCGCKTELHGPCHLDDAIRSDTGKAVDLSGGWHDEGVAQYAHLTARTTTCLARLRRSHTRKYRLGLNENCDDDLLAEVAWGVQSILKYELEPGVYHHALVAPHWYYTDNQPGTGDERKITPFHPHQLSCWWRAEALALGASVCGGPLRSKARAAAERYWGMQDRVDDIYTEAERARWKKDADHVRINAARICASIELFRLTGEQKYADDAARTGDRLLTFQERTPRGEGGLVGYFRKNLGAPDPYAGVNGKSLDVPGKALADLLAALPDHPRAPAWREALRLYVDGTLKPLARLNAPYGGMASGPYDEPITDLFPGEKLGNQWVYPSCFMIRTKKRRHMLRHAVARPQLNSATALAAAGRALKDDELLRMAHGPIRFLLGANPFHTSLMRNLGERCPVNAQLPNVPGAIVCWMGVTSKGLPFFDPYGAGRLNGPDLYAVKEGNTAICAYLLEACSYLENGR